ncbi:hypothetical protein DESUT3_31090 [Desulfuromonas versatilis]|uniref:DUF302 domain-containing protein n=1 Tax=Desulfuromonas versatilis TaxID=2802975 RepID=A0ABM8HZK3_9BACT|nr:DUF302 domain-containing protein [Desulfuromonas versatilis]BCR06040.1 hypothetical protein DESUT3_31090 [Desulfuromonas versatilis]
MEKVRPYGFGRTLEITFERAVERVTAALREQGFSIFTEIDVRSAFREKLDLDFRRYTILGTCIPQVALKALTLEPSLGLLLPCNVIVYEEDHNHTTVMALEPAATLGRDADPALQNLLGQVRDRFAAALGRV